jgi:rubrerythrin
MKDPMQEHFYRNLKLSDWRTQPFESIAEQRRAMASDEYKHNEEFRASVSDKIAVSLVGPSTYIGKQEQRAEVQTGVPEVAEAHEDQEAEYAANLAALIAREGPSAGPPPKATAAPVKREHYNGFVNDRSNLKIMIDGNNID